MKLLLLLLLVASSQFAAAAGFSIYLAPPAGPATEDATLDVREDIHIEINGKAIPLRLKEARQSIEYPCAAGAVLNFFRMNGEGTGREILCSVRVPAQAAKGLIVFAPRGGKLVASPVWWSASDLKKGTGLFINLSGRELGLSCSGQRVRLMEGKQWAVPGKFSDGVELTPVRVEIFDQRSGTEVVRILDQSVAIPKSDTGIFLILPKLGSYVSLLVMEAGGARDPAAREVLAEALAADGDG